MLVSLEDELGLLDQRFGELLGTAQNPDCSSWPNAEVCLMCACVRQLTWESMLHIAVNQQGSRMQVEAEP